MQKVGATRFSYFDGGRWDWILGACQIARKHLGFDVKEREPALGGKIKKSGFMFEDSVVAFVEPAEIGRMSLQNTVAHETAILDNTTAVMLLSILPAFLSA